MFYFESYTVAHFSDFTLFCGCKVFKDCAYINLWMSPSQTVICLIEVKSSKNINNRYIFMQFQYVF